MCIIYTYIHIYIYTYMWICLCPELPSIVHFQRGQLMQPHPSDIRGSSHGCCRKTAAGTPFALVCWKREPFNFLVETSFYLEDRGLSIWWIYGSWGEPIWFGEPYYLFEAKEVIRSVGAASGVVNPLTLVAEPQSSLPKISVKLVSLWPCQAVPKMPKTSIFGLCCPALIQG